MNLPQSRKLYDFQKEGVKYLVEHHGGFLWDEPGLGKTTQAIVAAAQFGGPILVVCPNTLKSWWVKEIKELYPQDSVAVAGVGGRFYLYGRHGKRELHVTKMDGTKWVICHYTGLRIDVDYYGQVDWKVVIADECHYVKNRNAKRTKALHGASPRGCVRIGLTATPFSNNPADLWSQLHWYAPTVEGLQSYWRFFNWFVDYTMEYNPKTGRKYRKVNGGKRLPILAQCMAMYGVQRTKIDVAPQLPPLTNTYLPLEIEGRQEKVFNALKQKGRVEIGIAHTDGSKGYTPVIIRNVLSRLTKMEQWLSHPWTYDPAMKGAKLEWLLEWAANEKYPAVIATRFKASAKRIAADLEVPVICGDVPVKIRNKTLDAWNSGEHQFLVGTIHTLGTGLNLQKAHTMIAYDQVYGATLMDQLRHRIHRIVSDHPVQIIYLYARDTSNELVMKSFLRKWKEMQLVKEFLAYIQEGGDDE